jgi:hypothetical protein
VLTGSRVRAAATIARLAPFYFAVAALKHVVTLPVLTRWAWRSPAPQRDHAEELRLARCVVKLTHLAGAPDRNCLERSLLLYRELSRAGASPELCVGFRPGPPGRSVDGHAWVTVDGQPVLEEQELPEPHQSVVRFGDRGRRLP